MAPALQIALFLASVAIVVFVIASLAALVHLRKNLDQTTKTLDELKSDVKLLVADTHKLVTNVNDLTDRAHRQLADIEHVVSTVRNWSDRTNRIVTEVGAALEPPLLTVAKNVTLFRAGLGAFLQVLFHRIQQHHRKEEGKNG